MAGFRRNRITRPIRRWAKRALPQLSATEAEALGAGEVWWEGRTPEPPADAEGWLDWTGERIADRPAARRVRRRRRQDRGAGADTQRAGGVGHLCHGKRHSPAPRP